MNIDDVPHEVADGVRKILRPMNDRQISDSLALILDFAQIPAHPPGDAVGVGPKHFAYSSFYRSAFIYAADIVSQRKSMYKHWERAYIEKIHPEFSRDFADCAEKYLNLAEPLLSDADVADRIHGWQDEVLRSARTGLNLIRVALRTIPQHHPASGHDPSQPSR